jgi:hypothetical protein
VEEVGGLVPVDPHPPKVITQEIVKRISGKEGQAVWNPVRLVWRIVEIRLGPSSQVADSLCALLVCIGPNSERNTIKGVGRVLLEDKGMVHAVRLASSSANFNIVREAGL